MKKPIIGVYLKCFVPLTAVVIKDETQKSKEMEKYYNKKKGFNFIIQFNVFGYCIYLFDYYLNISWAFNKMKEN